jgi:hypothetical protein
MQAKQPIILVNTLSDAAAAAAAWATHKCIAWNRIDQAGTNRQIAADLLVEV